MDNHNTKLLEKIRELGGAFMYQDDGVAEFSLNNRRGQVQCLQSCGYPIYVFVYNTYGGGYRSTMHSWSSVISMLKDNYPKKQP